MDPQTINITNERTREGKYGEVVVVLVEEEVEVVEVVVQEEGDSGLQCFCQLEVSGQDRIG